MAAGVPQNPSIYHITHIQNLAGMIGQGRLWCDSKRIAMGLSSANIGMTHIKARRLRHRVAVAVGGTLGDYVPFNFCNRSVMLYVVYRGHDDYNGGQRDVVHLVSSMSSIQSANRPFFFTDRHADLAYAQQYQDPADLGEVDWAVMPLTYWSEPEVKEKRQAEFLVHDFCPWTAITQIGVLDAATATVVQGAIARASHQPAVVVKPGWYYPT